MKTLSLLIVLSGSLVAQPSSLTIGQPAPAAVSIAGAFPVNQPTGATNLYYWVIARTPAGTVAPRNPAIAFRTVGAPSLSVSQYVTISWAPVAGATGYDVIRSSTPGYPAGASCTCAVVLNTSSTTVNDTGAALSAYPPGGISPASNAIAEFTMNNRDEATPYINLRILKGGVEYLTRVLELSGAIAEDDCLKYSQGRAVSAGAACGSGSGSYIISTGLSLIGSTLSADFGVLPGLATSNLYNSLNDFSAGTFRNTTGAGVPSAGTCNAAGHVGKLYTRNDAAAANASVYSCNLIGVATYGWELVQSAGGGGTVTEERWFPTFSCSAGAYSPAPASGWRHNPEALTTITGGSSVCGATYPNTGTPESDVTVPLPDNWTGNIDVKFLITDTGGLSTSTVRMSLETACYTTAESTSVTFNSPAQTVDISISSNFRYFTGSISTITTTGCAAGEFLILRVKRVNGFGGNAAGDIVFNGIKVKLSHS